MSEEEHINKRLRTEDGGGDEGAAGDEVGAGADAVAPTAQDDGSGGPREPEPGPEEAPADDGGDQGAPDAGAPAPSPVAEAPKIQQQVQQQQVQQQQVQQQVQQQQLHAALLAQQQVALQQAALQQAALQQQQHQHAQQQAVNHLPVQHAHHQAARVEENPPAIETYYKQEQQRALDPVDYAKVAQVAQAQPQVNAAQLQAAAQMHQQLSMAGIALGVGGMANLGGVNLSGVGLGGVGLGGVDHINQQYLVAQQRHYEMNVAKAAHNQAAAAAAAARQMPQMMQQKPPQQPSRKPQQSSYEPSVQLTASGRPARARRVNYAELAGALQDDEEEDDQSNLVPNWARRKRKAANEDRDYGPGVGGGSSRNSNANAAAAAAAAANNNAAAMYGIGNTANAAALAGQAANWQQMAAWSQQNPALAGNYAALQTLAAAQARPQMAQAQQFMQLQQQNRGVMDMVMLQGRGVDGQGGLPGAGQPR